MSVPKFTKCNCKNCGGHIEFPLSGLGQVVQCPHCGLSMELTADAALLAAIAMGDGQTCPECGSQLDEAGSCATCRGNKRRRTILVLSVVIAGLAMGLIYFSMVFMQRMKSLRPTHTNVSAPAQKTNVVVPKPAKAEPPADLWNGLKAGPITIEKTEDSRLIYAVGTVRNESDHQRFGVKVDLDLFNAQGKKVGTATDSNTGAIEPGKEWKFKAMVFEPKAVTATLVNMSEK